MIVGPLIERKRDGAALSAEEWSALVAEYTAGHIPDYQIAALLMAVFLRGLERQELAALTDAMLASGDRLSFDGLKVPVIDKHSTGGVGDKVSLVLAPLVAACGIAVPMMSGRGLGHTGGTLDKLEAIPGFRTNLSLAEARAQVQKVGCALIGQTAEIAPADRKLYALRDVTATVESIPLIAASIMSKKIAGGADAIVLDVKVGDGAFMKARADAEQLADVMIDLGRRAGREVVAVISDMNEPLGHAVGNALEIREAIATLRGEGPADFVELVGEASTQLLALSDLGVDREEARAKVEQALGDGSALAAYERWITAQGGNPDEGVLPTAPVVREVPAPRAGYVQSVGAVQVGNAALRLGAGRRDKDDPIDHSVGVVCLKKRGDQVSAGEPLAEIHARDDDSAASAADEVLSAYELGDDAPAPRSVILGVMMA
jgi:pyrimidine-nucleoside phosphorylase